MTGSQTGMRWLSALVSLLLFNTCSEHAARPQVILKGHVAGCAAVGEHGLCEVPVDRVLTVWLETDGEVVWSGVTVRRSQRIEGGQ